MRGYTKMIIEDTGCTPGEAREVEQIMRDDVFHSTLDWQSREEFREGARTAYRIFKGDPALDIDPDGKQSFIVDVEQKGGVALVFDSYELNGHDPAVFKALVLKYAKQVLNS